MGAKKLFLAIFTVAIVLAVGHIFTIGYGIGYDAISRSNMAVEQAKRYEPTHLAVIYERTVGERSDFLHLEVDTTYRSIGRHAFHYQMICDREIKMRAYDGNYVDCSDIAANCFIFNNNQRKWQLHSGHREIIDQRCELAIINIDGMEYSAWYTTALPHYDRDSHPSQLYEGLILEVYNAEGSYELKAKQITQHLG